MENNSNELKHYGVLGMQWGVRRAQNEQGKHKKKANYSKKRLSDLNKQRIKKGAAIAGGILAAIGSVIALDYGLKKSTGGAGLAFAKDMLIVTAQIKAKGTL